MTKLEGAIIAAIDGALADGFGLHYVATALAKCSDRVRDAEQQEAAGATECAHGIPLGTNCRACSKKAATATVDATPETEVPF